MRWVKRAIAACCCACAITASAAEPVPFIVTGDAIDAPLGGLMGDAARGRAIVANRQVGLCVLCHQAPLPEVPFQGDLATNLAGVGARATPGQLRLRVVDARKVNPQSIMPSYYRADDLNRVGASFRGKTILSAQQIEDVVAYLVTLR
jgi:L-cysteine S-thiosulfotransferase